MARGRWTVRFRRQHELDDTLRSKQADLIVGFYSRQKAVARTGSDVGTAPLAFGPYVVQASTTAPARAFLAAVFPNPGAGTQTLAYGLPSGLPAGTLVHLDLYDVRGALVRRLVDRAAEPGRFVVSWDGRTNGGRNVAAGVYLYRLTAGPVSLGGRLVRLNP